MIAKRIAVAITVVAEFLAYYYAKDAVASQDILFVGPYDDGPVAYFFLPIVCLLGIWWCDDWPLFENPLVRESLPKFYLDQFCWLVLIVITGFLAWMVLPKHLSWLK